MAEQQQTDGFETIEPANLVVIGDGKKQSKEFGGLLVDIVEDEQYPEKVRYVCVGKDEKDYEIAGNAALSKRIRRSHIGCLIKIKFMGRERGAKNEYKLIEVRVQPRDQITDKQKKLFPRWFDFESKEQAQGQSSGPAPEKAEGDEAASDSTDF